MKYLYFSYCEIFTLHHVFYICNTCICVNMLEIKLWNLSVCLLCIPVELVFIKGLLMTVQ